MLDRADERLSARIARLPLFEEAEYLRLNPDLAGRDLRLHYREEGLRDGRRIARLETLAAFAGAARPAWPDPPPATIERLTELAARAEGINACVLVAPEADYAVRDLAQGLVDTLTSFGLAARLEADHAAPNTSLLVVVGPERFPGEAPGPEATRRAVVVTTEPVHGERLTATLRAGLPARGVIAADPAMVTLFQATGAPTLAWTPSPAPLAHDGADRLPQHPLVRGLRPAARAPRAAEDVWSERPLDVVFLGHESEARAEALAACADLFSGLDCAIQYERNLWAPFAAYPEGAQAALAGWLAGRTKILLNLHAEEIGGLDPYLSLLQGLRRGALMVSTPCMPHPWLRAGEHYLEESPRRLPKLIDWLLRTPEGRLTAERVRSRGRITLAERFGPLAVGAELVGFLLEHGRAER